MHTLEQLRDPNVPMTEINDKWVPSRPLNGRKEHATFKERFHDAWEVFMCRAEAFTWPEGQ